MLNAPYTGNNDLDAFLSNIAYEIGDGSGSGSVGDPTTGIISGPDGSVVGYLYRYISIKYADDNVGTSLTNVPLNKAYYGVCNSELTTESLTPADYTWYLVTGTFGTTRSLYYKVIGGRNIKFDANTAPIDYKWLIDPGTVIDLDNIVPTKTISNSEIINATIGALQIADGAVSAAKTNVAAISAITGNLVDNAVGPTNIQTDAVTSAKIVANAVIAGKIAANAVTATTIEANAVTAAKIATDAVTANKIEANAVTAVKINAGAVTTDKVDALAITAGKIATDAITSDKIFAGSIIAGKIATDAVTADKILAGAVTAGKISVVSLSAVSANMGTVTVASGGYVNSTGKTYGSATSGFFLGSDAGVYKFDVGNSTNYFRFNGSVLSLTGDITGASNINVSKTIKIATAETGLGDTDNALEVNISQNYGRGTLTRGYAQGIEAYGGKIAGYFYCDGSYASNNTGVYTQASTGTTGIGIHAIGSNYGGYFFGGTGYETFVASRNYGIATNGQIRTVVAGAPFSLTSSTMSPNLNADMVDGIHANRLVQCPVNQVTLSGVSVGASVGTYLGNKPGVDSSNSWITITIDGNVFYVPAWT